jgi:NarL family two-component system response regulator LiaR
VSQPLRVALLSHHQLTHAGLTHLLSQDNSRASVVGGPIDIGHLDRFDVVVFDLAGPHGPIPDHLAILLAEHVPVVALTSYERSHLAETALAMGVAEVVHLDVDAAGLLQALERAVSGRPTNVVAFRSRYRDTARTHAQLTAREVSILELVGAGLLNQDIADQLYLSVNTVKTYIRTAYRKIGVTRRAEAVLWAVHHGLIPRPLGVPLEPVRFGVDLEANRIDRPTTVQPRLGDAMAAVHQLPV